MSPGRFAPGSVLGTSVGLDIDVVRVRTVAEGAARAAGGLLRERIGSIREIRHKGLVDLVTDVDEQSERLVRQTIQSAFPTHSILGEEGGAVKGDDLRYRWIVDPLDGTTNYAHGFPFFCVSIAFEAYGELLVGAVYDPNLDEMFLAERGKGASLNSRPIRVSGEATLQQALLATGFPYDRRRLPRAMKAFEVMSLQSRAVRRAGSAALDLCYVACGRFEGYWEFVVNPWDVAGGVLMVTEAGGHVTRVDGSSFAVESGEVLATNGAVHEAMRDALSRVPGS
jgi:myo-inositol-1(or 4)-monophosphatase